MNQWHSELLSLHLLGLCLTSLEQLLSPIHSKSKLYWAIHYHIFAIVIDTLILGFKTRSRLAIGPSVLLLMVRCGDSSINAMRLSPFSLGNANLSNMASLKLTHHSPLAPTVLSLFILVDQPYEAAFILSRLK